MYETFPADLQNWLMDGYGISATDFYHSWSRAGFGRRSSSRTQLICTADGQCYEVNKIVTACCPFWASNKGIENNREEIINLVAHTNSTERHRLTGSSGIVRNKTIKYRCACGRPRGQWSMVVGRCIWPTDWGNLGQGMGPIIENGSCQLQWSFCSLSIFCGTSSSVN